MSQNGHTNTTGVKITVTDFTTGIKIIILKVYFLFVHDANTHTHTHVHAHTRTHTYAHAHTWTLLAKRSS